MVWIEFGVCAVLLTYSAFMLCAEGIILSEKTKITHGLIGVFFLAIATSFPEIVTSITAVGPLGKIGLGYGDIVGSIVVNLMVLAFLDHAYGKGRILLKTSKINLLTGIFALVITFGVLSVIYLRGTWKTAASFHGVGIESLLIAGLYVTCLKVISGHEDSRLPEVYTGKSEGYWTIWGKFILLLASVVLFSVWMAKIGERIVLSTVLSQTFTGSFLLGFATSLPEIIVSFAALKKGSVDMAVGNILGSNLFDISILPALDALTKNPILGMLSAGEVIVTVFAVILSGMLVISLRIKRESRARINWDTGIIFITGLLGFVILYYVK